jgi:hypothetical protein
MRTLVSGHQAGRGGLFASDRLVDPLAHIDRATATLGALAASAKDIDWTTGAGSDGGVDFTFPDGPANANVHKPLTFPLCSCDLLADRR